jgi:hypothetical protein
MNTNTNIAEHGSRIAAIIGRRSQYKCIKIAQIKPALRIINNMIKPHLVKLSNPYQSTQ